jgi:hypothetical protein
VQGNVSQFEVMRGQVWSAKEREWKLQEKTVKDLVAKGATRDKAEKEALAKLNLAALRQEKDAAQVGLQPDPPMYGA